MWHTDSKITIIRGMKEFYQTVIELPLSAKPEKILDVIENEVRKYWDEGWVFVRAEPDGLLESVRVFFEREVHVE